MKNSAYDLSERQLAGTHADVTTYDGLASWLVQELDNALSSRTTTAEDIAYRWKYYEQARTRRSSPWPDAADLTSPYGTEFVDAMLGRIMDTIMVDPVWIVEGWGASTARAPFVEEFHQRAQEQERLQGYLREVLLRALIEPCGILEISEAVDIRRTRKTMQVALQLDDLTHAPIIGLDASPVLQRDAQGGYVEAADPQQPQAETVVDVYEPVRLGPSYEVVPYLDYVRFPQHARSKSEIWGYGKRFFRRVPELVARAAQGFYDREAVEALGASDERVGGGGAGTEPDPMVATQYGPTAQKELWEMPFLADLDGKGSRWWLATISRQQIRLLRLKVDDRLSRFLEFVPFPKPGSRDGYSLIEKMLTLLEEDTAVRNMRADRAALAVGGTMLRQEGSSWDPYDQPIGPGAVITVRDVNTDIRQLQITDVPQSINVWHQNIRTDLERTVGLNDVSVGSETQARRTLGEVRLAAGYSEVRVKAIITAIQESLEELGLARHDIWKQVLADTPQGIPAPSSLVQGLDVRGIQMDGLADGRITKDMLAGQFWFKPHGSVQTADKDVQAQKMNGLLQTLIPVMQINPLVRALFNTPQAAKALVEQMLRVTDWPDKQAFLGSEGQASMQQAVQAQQAAAEHAQMMQDPRMQALLLAAHHGAPDQGGAPGQPPGMPTQSLPMPGPQG